jgi:hypothetical protein
MWRCLHCAVGNSAGRSSNRSKAPDSDTDPGRGNSCTSRSRYRGVRRGHNPPGPRWIGTDHPHSKRSQQPARHVRSRIISGNLNLILDNIIQMLSCTQNGVGSGCSPRCACSNRKLSSARPYRQSASDKLSTRRSCRRSAPACRVGLT